MVEDSEKIRAMVYYTPVNDPSKIEKIEVSDDHEYDILNEFITRITKRKKNPEISKFQVTNLYEFLDTRIKKIRVEYPTIDEEDIKNCIESITIHAYTTTKSKKRYCAFIITSEIIFFYYFEPQRSFDFQGNKLVAFIKYLDESTLIKFLIFTNKRFLSNFYDVDRLEKKFDEDEFLLYAYEKVKTKGFSELISGEPVYERKGKVKIRAEVDSNTDLVIETHTEAFPILISSTNFSSVKIDTENAKAKITGSFDIKEFEISQKKYDPKDSDEFCSRVDFENYEIDKIMDDLKFYINLYKECEIVETTERLTLVDKEGTELKRINKQPLQNKSITYVLGSDSLDEIIKNDRIVSKISDRLKNNNPLNLVEISRYSKLYRIIDFDTIEIFARIDYKEDCDKIKETFIKLLERVKGEGNYFYERLIKIIYLTKISEFIKSKPLKRTVYNSGKIALKEIFSELSKQKHSFILKEMDKIGIEFKAGILKRYGGFFDSSSDKFSKKIIENAKKKKLDTIVYFIGINEDNYNFSPMPLNRLRNEFIESCKEKFQENNFNCHFFEKIPINNKDGILIIIISKENKNKEVGHARKNS